jgi:small subunit ribosomal protein S24e
VSFPVSQRLPVGDVACAKTITFLRALTIAAILGSRDPFLAPMHLREQSNEIKDFWSPKHFRSDALCVEAAFNAWWEKQSRGDYRSANDFLSDNLLNKATMLGIQQIREQLYDALVHANALTLISGKRYVKRRRQLVVPEGFDVNADSLPLKAALISIGSIPNFAIRTSPKTCRTAQDAVSYCALFSL